MKSDASKVKFSGLPLLGVLCLACVLLLGRAAPRPAAPAPVGLLGVTGEYAPGGPDEEGVGVVAASGAPVYSLRDGVAVAGFHGGVAIRYPAHGATIQPDPSLMLNVAPGQAVGAGEVVGWFPDRLGLRLPDQRVRFHIVQGDPEHVRKYVVVSPPGGEGVPF